MIVLVDGVIVGTAIGLAAAIGLIVGVGVSAVSSRR